MKTYYKLFTITTMLFLITTACSVKPSFSKEDYIQRYQEWTVKLENNYTKLDNSDWPAIESQFDKFSKTDYNKFFKELTPEEKHRIKMLTDQYYLIKGKYKGLRIKKKFKNTIQEAKGLLKELTQ